MIPYIYKLLPPPSKAKVFHLTLSTKCPSKTKSVQFKRFNCQANNIKNLIDPSLSSPKCVAMVFYIHTKVLPG